MLFQDSSRIDPASTSARGSSFDLLISAKMTVRALYFFVLGFSGLFAIQVISGVISMMIMITFYGPFRGPFFGCITTEFCDMIQTFSNVSKRLHQFL